MFVIRRAQLDAIAAARRAEFEASLVRHVETSDAPVAVREGRDARTVVRRTVDKCLTYGIDRECDIVDYLDFVLRFGLDFERRPELGACRAVLENHTMAGPAKVSALASRLPED